MRPSSLLTIGLLIAALVVYFCLRKQPTSETLPTYTLDAPGKIPTVIPELVATEQDEALDSVRVAFREDQSTATRIRLQSKLAKRWSEGVPLDLLVREICDSEAPTAYRSYLARLLRNEVKRDAGIYAKFAESLRQTIGDPNDTLTARTQISRALIDIDESNETVTAVASLLQQTSNDAEAVSVISALTRTKHAISKRALWEFAQRHQRDPDAFPKALAAAVLPLSHSPDVPLTDLLNRLSSTATDPTLLASVSKALTNHRNHE